jgi:hypothetical protein
MGTPLTPAQLAAMAAAQMVAQRTEIAKKQVRLSPAASPPRVCARAAVDHASAPTPARRPAQAVAPARVCGLSGTAVSSSRGRTGPAGRARGGVCARACVWLLAPAALRPGGKERLR